MSNTQGTKSVEVLDYANDPRISRGTREFLKALNSPAPPELEKLSPAEARKVLETAQASVDVDYSGIEESEKTISADGYEILLNIVRPAGVSEKLPVFMFIHGGGWVLGDYPTHRRMVRDLVVNSGFAAFSSITRARPKRFSRSRSTRFTRRFDGSRKTAPKSTLTARIWRLSATASAAIWRRSRL